MIIELEIFKGEGTKSTETTTQTNNQKGCQPFTFYFPRTIVNNQCKNETCCKVRN